jgi:hypothetical protein
MAPLDGGNFQGINPSMLQQLIKSLSSGVTGAQPLANSYISQFTRVGLDTGPIQKLLADYGWASAQQPMLNRRYSLASHQPSGDFTDGWTEEGAGTLFYATTAAAKGAGTADAKQMQAYLDANDWSGIQKELGAMSQNGDDADYMAAFFSQLGPKGLYTLSLYAQGGSSSDAANEQEVQQIVGAGLATASYEMPLTMNFLQGMEPEHAPPGYATQELAGGWDTAALAPFLTEGEFSSQWLQTIAPSVLYQKSVEEGAPMPGGYDAIFTAIASNPDFAAQFYQQNSGQLDDYMTDPVLYHDLASDPGFGKFLEAATIPPQGDTNTKAFTANATHFVQLFGGGNQDTSSEVRQAMAAVAMNYFGDIQGTVTAAAKGAGSSMGLTASEWGSFVQNAMQDKTAAAFLMTSYANWRGTQTDDSLPSNGQGDGKDTPLYAGYWNDQSIGMLDYFFASNYQAAGAQAGQGNAVLDTLLEAVDAGGATLLTSVAFGPEAGAAEITMDVVEDWGKDAGKDAFSSAAESTLGKLTDQLTDSDGGPVNASDAADQVFSDLTTIQGHWANTVISQWNQSQVGIGTPGQVNAKDFPPVMYNGVQYTADPSQYEQQYGGTFMTASGTVMDPSQMSPKALAAYNAWLQDPAISSAVATTFSAESQGSLNSYYGAQMGGGG